MNMRYLIHLIGDIHQPLHVINYYSDTFPNGDESISFLSFHSFLQMVNYSIFNQLRTLPRLHMIFISLLMVVLVCLVIIALFLLYLIIHYAYHQTDERFDEIIHMAKEIANDCEEQFHWREFHYSVYLSGFEFAPAEWAEESYNAAIEIYKVCRWL